MVGGRAPDHVTAITLQPDGNVSSAGRGQKVVFEIPEISEIHSHSVRAVPGCGFTHLIHEASLAGRAGGVVIQPIVRRGCDHISIAVDVHVGRGRPSPFETLVFIPPILRPLPLS